MVRHLALTLACFAGPAAASGDGDIAATLQGLLATGEAVSTVQIDGCQVTIKDREESSWDGYSTVLTRTQTFHLGDLQTDPDAVHMSTRPERDGTGRLTFSLAFEYTEAAQREFVQSTQRMFSEQFESVSMAKIIWSIIAGSDLVQADAAINEHARAVQGDFGAFGARNWILEETVEDSYRDAYFSIGGPDYLMLYGQEADRLSFVNDLHAHRLSHCPES